ncbi:amino acid adenylation domain-containing protein [Coleofasciculus sp. H7-2]|uniref:amino acid adenylation domain-containing protein n=1 Tax=Coleofasciculus sp. H7-2 TaxID=3351545 RepID=UPI00366E55D8
MKPITEFLSELRRLEIKLWIDGERLRYSATPGTLTPDMLAEMRSRKSEILAFLQQVNPDAPTSIKPVSRNQDLPLCFAQQRVWFLDRLEGKSPAYNIPMALRLQGQLNVTALEQALKSIVERHEVLRTNFSPRNGSPIAIIRDGANLYLNSVDLRKYSGSDRAIELQRLIDNERLQSFDLEKDSLIRVTLLCLDEKEHILLLTLHHIISDGWSLNLLYRELTILYSDFSKGNSLSLPNLPIQYIDFAGWQREWQAGKAFEKQLCYWKKQLDGIPPLLELPLDRPRPTIQTFAGAKQSQQLDQTLSEALKTLSQREGVTLFMTLLTAFKVLLSRYSGSQDIVVGTPVAGRDRPELEGLIGFFLNTVVLRTQLNGNPSYKELLGQVREVTLGAYQHQEMPFEKLVEELQPERSLSYNPLFQVLFNMVNLEFKAMEMPGLKVEFLPSAEAVSKFDLTLYVREQAEGIRLDWVYNGDLFEKETIARMREHFQTLLEGIATNPNQPISDLPRPLLPLGFPNPAAVLGHPEYKLVTNRFANWVEQTPEHPAIAQGDRNWSYRELSQIAHSLTQILLSQGVKKGEVVAVYGIRSFGLIACAIAVFLSGGVLLTLDPNLPRQRQQLMLAEAKAKCLISVGTQHPPADLVESLPCIRISPETGELLDLEPSTNSINLPSLFPDDAAYIFFTSGTTGVPKGVLGCHKGLAHFLHWQSERFAIASTDRVGQLTGLSFDVVLRDIFLPLISGATLCLPPARSDLSANFILPWLERERISLLHTVPTLAQSWLIDKPAGVSLKALRWVFFAGEPLTETLVSLWREAFPESGKIVNLYGPTETTLAKCFYIVPEKMSAGIQPIGSPLSETQVLILTENNQLCSIGEPGEIVLRTPFRSLGYINDPTETQTRFVKNPYRDDEQDLVYYTGDRGRYRPDGLLEILGRIDEQVKIRGIRIEPQEIAAVISQHPAIAQTAVIAREDQLGNKYLVGYLVSHSEPKPTVKELRSFVQAKLPEYAIPSAFVFLDAIPLTPNGKIDRRALPIPNIEETVSTNFVPPRNLTEEILVNIWSELLGVRVGIYDNFFELGGHSLLATQIISRIRQAFEVELPLRSLFEKPTVAELAENLDWEDKIPPEETISSIPRDRDIPLSFVQVRLWLLEQIDGARAAYKISRALHLKGRLNITALEQAFQAIIKRHETLRTRFQAIEGSAIQVIEPEIILTLPVINLQELTTQEQSTQIQELAKEEAQRPFDLNTAPLLRVTLLRLSEESHVLLLTIHHIIADGWSMGIFFREISSFYEAFISGNSCQLPELPVQYADFAGWQRQQLQGKILETQLAYWKQQLGGAPPVLELPFDYPRPAVQTFQGASESQLLPKTLSHRLKALSQQENATLFMTLLAAFKILLYRYTGQEDIVVGSPVAGRNRRDIEGLIGFFINTIVLRTQLEENFNFRNLLSRLREVALGAYAHQDLPFEKLVEQLQPQRSLSYTPIFQVWFNMLNLGNKTLEMANLNLEVLSFPERLTKFDLSLYVQEDTDGINIEWVYNRNLFKAEAIALMKERFQTLLESIITAPEQPIGNLPLLSPIERQRLQAGKNLVCPSQPYTEFPKSAIEQSIPDRFEEQVRKYPHNIAVCTEKHQWTYDTLNDQANAIAIALRSNIAQSLLQLYGSTSERIALLLEHDALAIAAILGVLKAGKTYVPLDPTYPKLRLNYILQDCQATALLSNSKNLALAEELTQGKIPLINLDEIDFSQTGNEVQITIAPDTLAYILYTSGSTGQPKGVVQNHRNVLHFIRNYTNNLHIAPSDRLTLLSSYSFDAAIMDIFGALLNGATLYPIDIKEEGLNDFSERLRQQEITIYHSTPTVYRYFLATLPAPPEESALPKVRLVVLGGEEVVKQDVALYQKYFSQNCIFVNGLGPTESTVTLQYFINKETADPGNLVPVGYPVEDTEILLLDRAGNNAEIYGEIAIRSKHIALGYWQKSELTQAAFFPDLQGENYRIYRTGDLGRLRTDGNLEFLGRRDFQVKIRGFRIELGEIEATLAQHPSVKETVVTASKEFSSDKRLIAYLVPHPELVPAAAELHTFLQDRLPNYMVPAAFVMLDALPLTPNGKIDRLALPAPDLIEQKSAETFVAPKNDLELRLAKIWEKVLGVQPIGIRDNFFELGGHSLVAVELFSQIKKIIGADIPIATLFQAPTVEKLADIISQEGWSTPWLSLVPIKPEGSQPPFFFHGGAAEAMTWAGFGRQLPSDRPFYGLQLPALNGKATFQSSVEEIASICIKEIRSIQPNGPYFIGGHCFGGTIAFEIAQQLKAQGEEVSILALVDAYAPKTVPNNKLFLGIRASYHYLDFLIYKTFYYHAEQLKQKNFIGQLTYLADWLQKKVGSKLTKSKSSATKKRNHNKPQPIHQNSANPQSTDKFIPYEVRYLQAEKMNREVKAKYIPQVYPGCLLLFRANKQKLEWYFGEKLGWEDLAAAGVEIHEIPGIFGNLFNAASMPFLVQEMKSVLDKIENTEVEKL